MTRDWRKCFRRWRRERVCLFGNRKRAPVEVASPLGVKRQWEGVQPAETGAGKMQRGAGGACLGQKRLNKASGGEARSRCFRRSSVYPECQMCEAVQAGRACRAAEQSHWLMR